MYVNVHSGFALLAPAISLAIMPAASKNPSRKNISFKKRLIQAVFFRIYKTGPQNFQNWGVTRYTETRKGVFFCCVA